jgi:hypothetical protein
MELHHLPLARRPPAGDGAPAPAREGGGFARVYELAAVRRARREGIPERVRAEVLAAARLYEAMHAAGHEVRFATHDLSGRVVAQLCDLDGNVLRPVSLFEALHPPIEPDPAA